MDLKRIEEQLRTLIEWRLIRVVPGQRPEDLLVQRLRDAMMANIRTDEAGRRVAPNVYTLQVYSGSMRYWRRPGLLEALVDVLRTAASDAGLHYEALPTITLADDRQALPGEFRVFASHKLETVAPTQDVQATTEGAPGGADEPSLPENAFLIVEGVKEFPLKQPVINIGRRLDNTLVVDDPRVSRHHAQLRAIRGRFVLFDLNSSGGTFINGQRTAQTILYPGDVISLAGVSLIYGQDSPVPRRDLSKTAPRSQVGAERATAIMRSPTSSLRKIK